MTLSVNSMCRVIGIYKTLYLDLNPYSCRDYLSGHVSFRFDNATTIAFGYHLLVFWTGILATQYNCHDSHAYATSRESSTFGNQAEPDKCFYVRNIDIVKPKKRLDPEEDPAPDLVVEIDITSGSDDRLAIYKDLGVPEVWIYDGKSFPIRQLQNQEYVPCSGSLIFPNLPLLEIGGL